MSAVIDLLETLDEHGPWLERQHREFPRSPQLAAIERQALALRLAIEEFRDEAAREDRVEASYDAADARSRFLVVKDKAGKRWLPVFTSEAAVVSISSMPPCRATPGLTWPHADISSATKKMRIRSAGASFSKAFSE